MAYTRFFYRVLIALCAGSTSVWAASTLRILSDRTETNLKPVLDLFEKDTGIKVEAVFLEKGLLERLEANPEEADVVVTKDSALLELAKQKKLLQNFSSKVIEKNVPKDFRDAKNFYFIDAYRARVIIYSKERVKPEDLEGYESLADPRFKGKLCIRSGYHDYNINLWSQMYAAYGKEKTENIIRAWKNNLARQPQGNDREQAKMIAQGVCDVAIMNSYYYGIMSNTPEQKPWVDAIGVFFPNQKYQGTFILQSALALTKAKRNVKLATRFLEYMSDKTAQEFAANAIHEYPVNPRVAISDLMKTLGTGQPDVKEGKFKIHFVSLEKSIKYREQVVKFLDTIAFDK